MLLILLLGLIITSGCATEKVIYKTEYIKPEIPQLKIIDHPNLKEVKYVRIGNEYCISSGAVFDVVSNENNLKALIKAYEEEIKVYNDFRDNYYKN